MTKYRAIALSGVVLAVAILSPASVLAKPGGTNQTVKGTSSGTLSLDPQTGAFSGDTRGVISHIGKVTVQLEGTGAPTPEGTFAGSGTVTIVAANGDRLTGTSTFTITGQTTRVVVKITGGTGRFAHARGTLRVICHSGPSSQVGQLLVSTLECKVTGHISLHHRRHRTDRGRERNADDGAQHIVSAS